MPSNSSIRWNGERAEALDEIENAHALIGGTDRGRRYATRQINYAYTALLSSHFQGFCRDLHSECVDHIVVATPVRLQELLKVEFDWNRSLSKGNPHPGRWAPISAGWASIFGRQFTVWMREIIGGASRSKS